MNQVTESYSSDVVLVGGGHTHCLVLQQLAMRPLEAARVTLIADTAAAPYSGMLPGHIAGLYRQDEIHVDLWRLSLAAGVRLLIDSVVGIDAPAKALKLASGQQIEFDICSLNIGAVPAKLPVKEANRYIMPVKPVAAFLRHLDETYEAASAASISCVVIGAGAGGVEVALALQHRLSKTSYVHRITLVEREQLLPTFPLSVRSYVRTKLSERNIHLCEGVAVTGAGEGACHLSDGSSIDADVSYSCLGARVPAWIGQTGLPLSADGFVLVDEHLRVVGSSSLFAVGDVAQIENHIRPRAGVFAVRQARPLAENIRRSLRGKRLRRYIPQTRFLVALGEYPIDAPQRAVLVRGSQYLHGRLCWKLKEFIDRSFMRRFQRAAEMELDASVLEHMLCAGCAAKVPADVLRAALPATESRRSEGDERVICGTEAADDVAILALDDGQQLIQSVDMIPAFIEDEYRFAEIATHHAMNDVLAKGAVPHSALAIAQIPHAAPTLMRRQLTRLLDGVRSALSHYGVSLVAGHSARSSELALGVLCNAVPNSKRPWLKGGLRAGDAILLTKALGTGVAMAGAMRRCIRQDELEAALRSMQQSNARAVAHLRAFSVHACTDVSGFGLFGHLQEMLEQSPDTKLKVYPSRFPLLHGTLRLCAAGVRSSLFDANRRSIELQGFVRDGYRAQLGYDPQTSGGLLVAVSADEALACRDALREGGYLDAAVVAEVEPWSQQGARLNVSD